MNPVLKDIYNAGLLPVITPENLQDPNAFAHALHQAALTALCVDAASPYAEKWITALKDSPLHTGAYGIKDAAQALRAQQAGAKFILWEDCSPAACRFAQTAGIPVLPFCRTPEDAQYAANAGLTAACADFSGARTLAEQFPSLSFVVCNTPRQEIPALITHKNILACAGGWLTASADDTDQPAQQARALTATMLDFDLRHVGINSADEAESSRTADAFERFFGFPKTDRGGAYFAGEIIEVMKKPFYGTHGHIAITTRAPERAVHYLQHAGARFNWDSAGYNPDGALRVVYLQDEIGGFAVHILKK